jgi:transposase
MRKTCTTDLSDAERTRLRSYLSAPKAEGRPRTHSLRDVLDAIFYVLKSGCHWRLWPLRNPSIPNRSLDSSAFDTSRRLSVILSGSTQGKCL